MASTLTEPALSSAPQQGEVCQDRSRSLVKDIERVKRLVKCTQSYEPPRAATISAQLFRPSNGQSRKNWGPADWTIAHVVSELDGLKRRARTRELDVRDPIEADPDSECESESNTDFVEQSQDVFQALREELYSVKSQREEWLEVAERKIDVLLDEKSSLQQVLLENNDLLSRSRTHERQTHAKLRETEKALEDSEALVDTTQTRLEKFRDEHERLQATVEESRGAADAAGAHAESLASELHHVNDALRNVKRVNLEVLGRVKVLDGNLVEAKRALERSETEKGEISGQRRQLAVQMHDVGRDLEESKRQKREADTKLNELMDQLKQSKQTVIELQLQMTNAQAQKAHFDQQISDKQVELDHQRSLKTASDNALLESNNHSTRLQEQLRQVDEKSRAAVETSRLQFEIERSQNHELRESTDRLQASLAKLKAESEDEHRRLRTVGTTHERTIAELKAEHDRTLQSKNDEVERIRREVQGLQQGLKKALATAAEETSALAHEKEALSHQLQTATRRAQVIESVSKAQKADLNSELSVKSRKLEEAEVAADHTRQELRDLRVALKEQNDTLDAERKVSIEMRSVKTQLDNQCRGHRAAHEAAESRANEAQAQLEQLRERTVALEAQITTLEETAQQHQADAASMRQKHENALEELSQEHKRNIDRIQADATSKDDRLKTVLVELDHMSDDKAESTKQYALNLEDLRREHSCALERQKSEHDRMIKDMSSQRDADLERVRLDHVSAMQTLTARHSADGENLASQHDAEVKTLRKKHQADMFNLCKDNSEAIDALKADHASTLARLSSQHAANLNGASRDSSKALDTLKNELTNTLNQVREEGRTTLESARHDHQEKLAELLATKQAEIDSLQAMCAEHAQELHRRGTEFAQLRKTHQNALHELAESNRRQQAAVDSEHQHTIEELRADHAEELQRHDGELNALRIKHRGALAELEATVKDQHLELSHLNAATPAEEESPSQQQSQPDEYELHAKLTTKILAMSSRIYELERERNEQSCAKDELQTAHEAINAEKADLESQIHNLRQQLDKATMQPSPPATRRNSPMRAASFDASVQGGGVGEEADHYTLHDGPQQHLRKISGSPDLRKSWTFDNHRRENSDLSQVSQGSRAIPHQDLASNGRLSSLSSRSKGRPGSRATVPGDKMSVTARQGAAEAVRRMSGLGSKVSLRRSMSTATANDSMADVSHLGEKVALKKRLSKRLRGFKVFSKE